MGDYKVDIGILTIAIGIISYSFYFRNVFRGKTKPDPFSWLIWGMLATIAFSAQITKDGGAGTWATAFTACVCFLIALLSYSRNRTRATYIDILSLAGAVIAMILWYLTNNPLFAVILIIVIGAVGFIPTFEKAFYRPNEETATTYALNALKFALAILALQSLSPVTWLYPGAITLMNISLATMLILRRTTAG